MQKHFLLATAAIAVLASCSKVETFDTPSGKISFEVANYASQTKVGETSLYTDEGISSFYTTAYLNGSTAKYMDNVTVTYDGTSKWAPASTYYWIKGQGLDFVSYYYVSAAPTLGRTESSNTLSWSNAEISGTENILYADEAWDYEANETTYAKDGVTEGVPTLFHHALAKVKFVATTAYDNASQLSPAGDANITWDIEVTSAKLTGVYNTGTLELTNDAPVSKGTQAWTTSGWTSQSNAVEIPFDSGLNTALAKDAETTLLDYYTVLPQTLADSQQQLVLEYTVKTLYNGVVTSDSDEQTATFDVKAMTLAEWGMNKKITYTITINPVLGQILFDPAVEDWDETSTGSVTIENGATV